MGHDAAYALRVAAIMLAVAHAATQAGRSAPDRWRCLHNAACLPQPPPGKALTGKIEIWAPYFVWDAGHYDAVSKSWYAASAAGTDENRAFWPLWPAVLHTLRAVTANVMMFRAAVILVASAIAAISVLAFHALAQHVLAKNQARRATLLYAFYPGAHFLIQSYPAGLLNLLVCLCLTATLKKRFWRAALWSGFATAAAPLGLTLAATLGAARGLHCLRLQRSRQAPALATLAAQAALAVSGMLAFMGILAWRTGSPFAFTAAEAMWSHPRSLANRLDSWFHFELVITDFLAAFKHIGRLWGPHHAANPTADWETRLNLLSIGIALTATYAGLRRLPAALTLQAWLLVALYVWLIATVQDAEASVRLLYAAPGIFLAIAWATRETPRLGQGIALLSLLLLAVESFLSGAGYWVV